MCKDLSEKIFEDERNGYIAVWHDESHINRFCHSLEQVGIQFTKLGIDYHVPGESVTKYSNPKLIYLDKRNYIETDSTTKNMTNGCKNTNGKVIPNKYNKI
jgi:hypothetical protein